MAVACGAAGWGALTVALATTIAPAATGCTTHQCDAKPLTWTTGDWIDANTWETSDINGRWMPYDGNSTITISWTHADTRFPYSVEPYVGVANDGGDNPNQDDIDGGDNFVNGAGALVEYIDWGQTHVILLNSTCASYVARFVIHFPPLRSDASATASAN